MIENKSEIPGTIFRYDLVEDMFEMVNTKKHDRIQSVIKDENGIVFAQAENGAKIAIPFGKLKGVNSVELHGFSKHSKGDNCIFEYNGQDIGTFCMKVKNLSRDVIVELYKHI